MELKKRRKWIISLEEGADLVGHEYRGGGEVVLKRTFLKRKNVSIKMKLIIPLHKFWIEFYQGRDRLTLD